MFKRRRPEKVRVVLLWAWLLVLALICGCASSEIGGSSEVRYGEAAAKDGEHKVSQAELQEDLQRFVSQFLDRLTQAIEEMGQIKDQRVHDLAARQFLRLGSSALDIASAPYPEVNLLDMMAFVRLNREVIEEFWVPKVYGEAKGRGISAVFTDAERDIEKVADKVSTAEQRKQFYELVENWRNENPRQVRVEWVRLGDISKKAGKIQTERAEQASGVLSGVRGAMASADQALLMAQRAMFLGQRLPFLLRLQARIGVHEILSDSMEQLARAERLTGQTEPLVRDLSVLSLQLGDIMQKAGPLMEQFRKYFPRDPNSTLTKRLELGRSIASDVRNLTDTLYTAPIENVQKGMQEARSQVDAVIWNIAKALVVVGIAWAAFWWLGYFLVKRPVLKAAAVLAERNQGSGKPPSSSSSSGGAAA